MALGRMLDKGLSPAVALLLSSALFALAHGANPGIGLLSLVNIALAGALMGAAYLRQRNLWEPIALHWAWNWLQGPVLGYGVSGITMGSPMLELHLAGSPLLTGGAFGFEASLPCTVLLALAPGLLGVAKWFYLLQRQSLNGGQPRTRRAQPARAPFQPKSVIRVQRRFRFAAMHLVRHLCRKRSGLRRDKAADKMPTADESDWKVRER